jgi:hypothetical protein
MMFLLTCGSMFIGLGGRRVQEEPGMLGLWLRNKRYELRCHRMLIHIYRGYCLGPLFQVDVESL